ncbi:MAG: calcium-binding protein [Bilophila wadsworthia]
MRKPDSTPHSDTSEDGLHKLAQAQADGSALKESFGYTVSGHEGHSNGSLEINLTDLHTQLGHAGADTLGDQTAAHSQVIFGEGGDVIHGGAGNDWLFGGEGDDQIFGGTGDDILYGGAGNDYLDGGTGHNSLYGGAGNDILSTTRAWPTPAAVKASTSSSEPKRTRWTACSPTRTTIPSRAISKASRPSRTA